MQWRLFIIIHEIISKAEKLLANLCFLHLFLIFLQFLLKPVIYLFLLDQLLLLFINFNQIFFIYFRPVLKIRPILAVLHGWGDLVAAGVGREGALNFSFSFLDIPKKDVKLLIVA